MLFFRDVLILFLCDVYTTLRSKLSYNCGMFLKALSTLIDVSVFLDD